MKIVRPLLRLAFSRRSLSSRAAGAAGHYLDDRLGLAGGLRKQLNKVFPENWSFMLGEIALYSFVVLLLTGTFLTFFFDPSMVEVRYDGSYVPLQGVTMSKAYASSLDLSFDVRGGLLIRQIHHWAALLFLASIIVHMCRIFFTAAFRKPREINWLIGLTLLALGIVEGFAGYSLPDDLLSGTGLRIADAIVLSIPVIGTWLSFLIFGGKYPGTVIIDRLYILHVLLIPGLILALIGAHVSIVVRQKHTEYPAAGRRETTVSGERFYPTYAMKSGGFLVMVFAALAALGGLAQINPVWLWGPYEPSQVSSGSQPDWYMLFLEGALRLFPPIELRMFGHSVSPVFWPAVVLPAVLGLTAASYPFLEARMSKDRKRHNLLQRPRDAPARTALGVMALSFWAILSLAGADDVIAKTFNVSLGFVVWACRIGLLIVPPLAFALTYWMCLGLEERDREVLEAGIETGIVVRTAEGDYLEVHQPLGPTDEAGQGLLRYAGTPIPKRPNQILDPSIAARPRGFFFPHRHPSDTSNGQVSPAADRAESKATSSAEHQ